MATTDRASQPAQQVTLLSQKPVQPGSVGTPASPTGHSKKPPTTGRGGARRLGVDEQGQYYYKNTPSSTLMASLQLGLQHSIGSIAPKPRRDILMTDFEVVETADFPSAGSDSTPAHKYKDFTFKTYSPEAFRFFREAFGILPEDFLLAMCDRPLRELSNPGASGSLFYLSADDAFIMKTVQKKEARFLQKLLPGYYLNMTQNKRTLLPKFFGLYRYKSGSVNIRIVVMNNLLPSGIIYHEKFDLKGSTYKRKANSAEVKKKSPTFKDLDFMEKHEEGIILAPDKYEALLHSVDRDCKVLESFGIMDYSLLLGVHNIDQAIRDKAEASHMTGIEPIDIPIPSRIELSKNFSIVSAEDIPALLAEEQQRRHHYPEGYIQGRIHGDRVMFYLGIIDILQSYRLKKKLEHGFKAVIADGSTVSVHNPTFYARRFQEFMTTQVFKKDKVKYKTRKNSTNAQLRGRRLASAARTPTAGGGADRPAVESRISPQLDLPTYNQAMKGAGVGLRQPDAGVRRRAQSASMATSLPVYSSRAPSTSAASTATKKSTTDGSSLATTSLAATSVATTKTSDSAATSAESKPSNSKEESIGKEPVTSIELEQASDFLPSLSITRAEQNMVKADEQIRSSQNHQDAAATDVAFPSYAAAAESDKQSPQTRDDHKTSDSSKEDFARHVRGTSTPIDPSPTHSPNQSRTFNGQNFSNGEVNSGEVNSGEVGAESTETLEGNSSVEEKKLRRGDAIEEESTPQEDI